MRKILYYLKNVITVVFLIHLAALVNAQNLPPVSEKVYYPSAQEWQVKSPQFFKIDSINIFNEIVWNLF